MKTTAFSFDQRRAALEQLPPQPVEVREGLRSSSDLLPDNTQQYMSSRFGHDFSKVRVHSGPDAADAAARLNAQAFTLGGHIFLGSGRRADAIKPQSDLLAHELTHVAQQRLSSPGPSSVAALEREAHTGARTLADGGFPRVSQAANPAVPLRLENDTTPEERWRKDDERLAQVGVTRQELVDFGTLTRGDFIDKYGLRRWWNFPRDQVRALPGDLLLRIVGKEDQTLYYQQGGRVSTNADEKSRQVRNFNPGTPIGGVAYVGARGVGASHETAQIAGAFGDVAQSALPARSESANLVPTRGGAAWGNKTGHYEPRQGAYKPEPPKFGGLGPQPPANNAQSSAPRVSTGEIKSANSTAAAKSKALGTWAANLPDKSYVAVVTYDEHGKHQRASLSGGRKPGSRLPQREHRARRLVEPAAKSIRDQRVRNRHRAARSKIRRRVLRPVLSREIRE